jgi:hypothetical protein
VLVLKNPGGIFILKDSAAGDGLYAAVATGGGAGTGPIYFTGSLESLDVEAAAEEMKKSAEKKSARRERLYL